MLVTMVIVSDKVKMDAGLVSSPCMSYSKKPFVLMNNIIYLHLYHRHCHFQISYSFNNIRINCNPICKHNISKVLSKAKMT